MPYGDIDDGLYLMVSKSMDGKIIHYGILDVGNVLQYPNSNGSHPIVYHQTPPRIQIQWLQDTGDGWVIIGQVTDIQYAKHRLLLALQNPEYEVFGNNCEHFARFVAGGKKYSIQIQNGGGLVALGIFAWAALNE